MGVGQKNPFTATSELERKTSRKRNSYLICLLKRKMPMQRETVLGPQERPWDKTVSQGQRTQPGTKDRRAAKSALLSLRRVLYLSPLPLTWIERKTLPVELMWFLVLGFTDPRGPNLSAFLFYTQVLDTCRPG